MNEPSIGGSSVAGGSSSGAGMANPGHGGGNAPVPVAGRSASDDTAGSANTPGGSAMGGSAMGGSATGGAATGGSATGGAADGAGGSGEPPAAADPVCGNGILETGEECDDAKQVGQDGCDSSCKVVCADFGSDAAESEDHHCYNGYDSATFEGSQEDCVERGGHLATIASAAENDLVRGFVNESKWIGGVEGVSDTSEGTGAYSWITSEPFTYTNWAAHEPDQARIRCNDSNERCYEHCVSMDGEGTWLDAGCELSDGYVCEWEPAGSKP